MQKVEADKVTHIPVTQQKLLLNFPVFFFSPSNRLCFFNTVAHTFFILYLITYDYLILAAWYYTFGIKTSP